jgi:hypothetical protein
MPTAASLPKHNHSANHKTSGKDERERYRPLDLERMAKMLPLEGKSLMKWCYITLGGHVVAMLFKPRYTLDS